MTAPPFWCMPKTCDAGRNGSSPFLFKICRTENGRRLSAAQNVKPLRKVHRASVMNASALSLELLVVEDNPAEARLIEGAFKTVDSACSLHLMLDCRNIIDYLRQEHQVPAEYRPHAILLDYCMPSNGGLTLRKLKDDPVLRYIPVMVITGMQDEAAVYDLYLRGANCCFPKPDDLGGYEGLARMITGVLRGMLKPRSPAMSHTPPRVHQHFI